MAIKKTVELEVNTNLEPTLANLRELKKQLRDVSAGSADFNKLSASIRDMEDSISDAKSTGDDFFGQLENAPGVLGQLGQGIRGAERTFSSFNGALKASVIGIFVSLLGGLVGAFRNNEGAMKKLQPVLDLIDKTFQGIYRAVEPLFDIFLDLAMKALPAVEKGIGIVYSAMVAYFTFLKEAGGGVMKILKGIFTLDTDTISQGIEKVGGSFKKTQESYSESMKRFSAGSKELTAKEKEELAEREKNEKEAADKRKEAQDKVNEKNKADREKAKQEAEKHAQDLLSVEKTLAKEIEDLNAKTEQEKLDLQAKRELEEILALEKKGDDITKIMQKYNAKYTLLDAQLQDKLKTQANEKSVKDKETADKNAAELKGILEKNSTELKDYKDAKNLEEIAQVKAYQQKLLDEQEAADIAKAEKLMSKDLTEEERAAQIQTIKDGYDSKRTENEKANVDARKKLSDEETAYRVDSARKIGDSLDKLSAIAGKNTAVGKGLAIASATINTYAGVTEALAAKSTLPSPFDVVAKVANVATILASGFQAVKSIVAVKVPGGAGGGGGGGAPSSAPSIGAPAVNVVGTSPTQVLSQQISNQQQQPVRAYVVANDVTTAQALDRNIISSSSIG